MIFFFLGGMKRSGRIVGYMEMFGLAGMLRRARDGDGKSQRETKQKAKRLTRITTGIRIGAIEVGRRADVAIRRHDGRSFLVFSLFSLSSSRMIFVVVATKARGKNKGQGKSTDKSQNNRT